MRRWPLSTRQGRGARPTIAVVGVGVGGVLAVAAIAAAAVGTDFLQGQVGQTTANGVLLPTNQTVSPVGTRALVENGRIIASGLSPDGTKLAASSWNDFTGFLTILDLPTHHVIQQLGTGSKADPRLGDGTVAADGPIYSADGKSLWLPQSTDIVRFTVGATGTASAPVVIKLPSKLAALPSGMALSTDGTKLYVAENGNNTLGVIDTTTNLLTEEIPVGNAPRQVAIVGNQAFVSNEGGRPTVPGDVTNLSFGTPIVSDPSTGAATTGTLSVVDLGTQAQTSTIPVGLQPTSMFLNGTTLMVTNSNDDSVSIVDTTAKTVTQTFVDLLDEDHRHVAGPRPVDHAPDPVVALPASGHHRDARRRTARQLPLLHVDDDHCRLSRDVHCLHAFALRPKKEPGRAISRAFVPPCTPHL